MTYDVIGDDYFETESPDLVSYEAAGCTDDERFLFIVTTVLKNKSRIKIAQSSNKNIPMLFYKLLHQLPYLTFDTMCLYLHFVMEVINV